LSMREVTVDWVTLSRSAARTRLFSSATARKVVSSARFMAFVRKNRIISQLYFAFQKLPGGATLRRRFAGTALECDHGIQPLPLRLLSRGGLWRRPALCRHDRAGQARRSAGLSRRHDPRASPDQYPAGARPAADGGEGGRGDPAGGD